MNLGKIQLYIILLYKTSYAWEKLIKNKNSTANTLKIYDVLVKIFQLHKKDYDTVLILSDTKEINLKWLEELHRQVSVFSYGNTAKYDGNLQHLKKFDTFVFIVEMPKHINETLLDIWKNTSWMNVLTPIYILYVETCDTKAAENIFKIIEAHELLTSYLICSNLNQNIKMYTYNIISHYAPDEWKPIEEARLKRNSTLFERTYAEGDVDSNFDFDRTKYLDDYEIIIASRPFTSYSTLVYNYYDQIIRNDHPEYLLPINRLIVDTFATAFKAKIKLYFCASQSSSEKYLDSYELYEYDVWSNSSCDVLLVMNWMYPKSHRFPLEGSYPALWSENGIVTYHQGYQTPAEKIRDFYGIWISLFTLFILIITFIVIWSSKNRNLGFTMFEMIRLLINQGLYTQMNTLSLRIFFGVVFIYFLIIQATFNGHLAEFLTKPQLRRHPETLDDLKDLGFTEVYDSVGVSKYLAKKPEEWASIESLTKTCLQYLMHNNTSAACIENYILLRDLTHNQKNLYLSKKAFGSYYLQHPIRRWSPLFNRIYIFFISFEEFGFRHYMHRNLFNYFDYWDKVEETNLNQSFRPINIANLMFAFVVLGIGLFVATLTFFIEKFLNFCKSIKRPKIKVKKIRLKKLDKKFFLKSRKLIVKKVCLCK